MTVTDPDVKHGYKATISARVPHAVTDVERISSARYYDETIHQLENQTLWRRTWQQACRLEDIPKVGDFVEYTINDESVLVTRSGADEVKAYYNHCRHRGMPIARGRGSQPSGFVCPFHGWCWSPDGTNTFVAQPEIFSDRALDSEDLKLRECKAEVWGGTVFVNFSPEAAPLRESLEPFASLMDRYNVAEMRTLWWVGAEIPANWKLGVAAFLEGYHVSQTHPQMMGRGNKARGARFAAQAGGGSSLLAATSGARTGAEYAKLTRDYLSDLGRTMGSWILERDIEVMDELGFDWLPEDPVEASHVYIPRINEEIVRRGRAAGRNVGDLNAASQAGAKPGVYFAFPNSFVLPWFGNAVWYRFRPTGPETCVFEVRSTTLLVPGEQPPTPPEYTELGCPDPRWPLVPSQDLSNLVDQQRGMHTTGFDFLRLSKDIEGRISNFEQLIDGYLADLPMTAIEARIRHAVGSIDVPVVDIWNEEGE
jgi:phenylpropionate dioxygenase-like ring-hydroxylating dioxygenase large terminal subunit